MIKHLLYRQGLHAVAGCTFFLAMVKFWPSGWVTTELTATLALLFIVAVREVWDLRVLKRRAVRIALNASRPGDVKYVTQNPWWKSWVDVAGWFGGVILALWLA